MAYTSIKKTEKNKYSSQATPIIAASNYGSRSGAYSGQYNPGQYSRNYDWDEAFGKYNPTDYTPGKIKGGYNPTDYIQRNVRSNYTPGNFDWNKVSSGYKPNQYRYKPVDNAFSKDMANYDVRDYNIKARDNKYAGMLEDALNKLNGMDKFSYDQSKDPLYQQYADQYRKEAKLAMQDTVGQAAALTGGYGNSYAETAGQAMYNQTMDQLNDRALDLYNASLDAYNSNLNRAAQQASATTAAFKADQSAINTELDAAFNNANLNENQRQFAKNLMAQWAQEANAMGQFNSQMDMENFFNNEANLQKAADMALQASMANSQGELDAARLRDQARQFAASQDMDAQQFNENQRFKLWNKLQDIGLENSQRDLDIAKMRMDNDRFYDSLNSDNAWRKAQYDADVWDMNEGRNLDWAKLNQAEQSDVRDLMSKYYKMSLDDQYRWDRAAAQDDQWAKEFNYQQNRAAAQDAQWNKEFNYQQSRDRREDLVNDRNFKYQQQRDARTDYLNDRDFLYQQGRDARADYVNDRNYNYQQTLDDRNYNYNKSRDEAADKQWGTKMQLSAASAGLTYDPKTGKFVTGKTSTGNYDKDLYNRAVNAGAGSVLTEAQFNNVTQSGAPVRVGNVELDSRDSYEDYLAAVEDYGKKLKKSNKSK